jgi:hypothetical protein
LIERAKQRRGSVFRLSIGRLFEKRDDPGSIEQVPVKQHLNRITGNELRLRLEYPEMDAANRPAILRTRDRLGDESSTARHRTAHPRNFRGDLRGSTAIYYAEKTGQLAYLRVHSRRLSNS